MNEKKTPAIRFQEFTDDWKQRKLGDKMYIKSRIGWQRLTKDEYLSSGEYYLITGTDIDEYTHTIDLKHSYYVSKDRYDKDSNIQVHNGDIIVTKDGTIGKVAMVCNLDKPATLNSHLFVLRDMSGKIYNRFLLQFLTSDLFTRFVDATKTGSTLTGMPQKIFVKFQYMIPSFSEQKKVADMLDGIANIIAIHQRKLTKLQLLKKSMLTKMFPKDGARVPEIRFQGFHGDWKQRKVSDICSISTGKSNTQDKEDDGIYPFYVRSPIIEHSNKYLYDEEAVLTVGDGVGTGKVFHYVNGKYDLHQRVYRMYGFSDNISAKFFYQYFSKEFYNRVMAMTAKTSVDSVRYKMIADMDIQLPSKAEQDKIAKFLFSLDGLISLHQHKLSKLQQIKQAMLLKLFV